MGDLWALQRAGAWNGLYHVLGGTLSAIGGVRPEDLAIGSLIARAGQAQTKEVVLALNATAEGQTTAHYITEQLKTLGIVRASGIACEAKDAPESKAGATLRPQVRMHLRARCAGEPDQ